MIKLFHFVLESSQAVKYGGCFSGNGTVQTSTGEMKKLSEVEIGEYVLAVDQATGKLVYSEVILFLDRNTEERREFLRVHTESGRTLTLTQTHLVLKGNASSPSTWETRFAGDLKINETVLIRDFRNISLVEDRVVGVKPILSTGVFAPLTKTGTLIVDGVAVSCYAVIDSQSIAHWSFAPVRFVINIEEGLERLWQIMARPLTGWESSKKPYPENGEYWYARLLYTIAKYLIPSHLHDQ